VASVAVGSRHFLSTGGCPITGYAVYIDDGTGVSNFTEANIANDPAVRGNPGLNSFTITALTASQAGTTFVIYVAAFNSVGQVSSAMASIILGDVPS
jgi:hypothetical protein